MYILLTAFLAPILDVTIIMITYISFLATPEYILVIEIETLLNIEVATAAAAHATTFAVVE